MGSDQSNQLAASQRTLALELRFGLIKCLLSYVNMAASIGDLINQLHSCCKLEESDNNSYRASDIIGNIQQIIFQELPNSENGIIVLHTLSPMQITV